MTSTPILAPLRSGDAVVAEGRPLRVVGVSGSLHDPSKTTSLVEAILDSVGRRGVVETRLIAIAQIGTALAGALSRDELPAEAEEALQAIEQADLLVVATPVYRASTLTTGTPEALIASIRSRGPSFTGLFKHLFDFVGQYALVGKPVLLAATGGGERHALIIEHQLRPLFAFFQALTLPVGVYASTADFDGAALRDGAVRARVEQAVDRALPLIEQSRRQPVSEYVSNW